jgi:hypothetical protein
MKRHVESFELCRKASEVGKSLALVLPKDKLSFDRSFPPVVVAIE